MLLLKNRLLVKEIEEEKKTKSGIAIPSIFKNEATIKAEVVMLGQKSQYGDWWLKVGDIVKMDNPKYSKVQMQEVEYNGDKCLIINENDVICSL